VASWLGRPEETRPFLTEPVRRLLLTAVCCCMASLLMISLELALV
jgi:hypothetical protein